MTSGVLSVDAHAGTYRQQLHLIQMGSILQPPLYGYETLERDLTVK